MPGMFYIFWCIAVGICCGISDFVTASIGSVTIFLLMLAIGGVRANTRYLLIVRGLGDYRKKLRPPFRNR